MTKAKQLKLNIWSIKDEMLDQYPEKYKPHYRRATSGNRTKTAMRSAITAHCLMCMGFNFEDVKKCTAPACPLYNFRPGGVAHPRSSGSAKGVCEAVGESTNADSLDLRDG